MQQGGTLTIEGGSLGPGIVTGGAGGSANAEAGSAYGSGIFIQGDQTITLAPPAGQSLTISDVIADETGSHDASGATGSGALVIRGKGMVVLDADTYVGGTTIAEGARLELAAPGAGGSGRIAVHGTLDLLSGVSVPGATIAGGLVVVSSGGAAGLVTFDGGGTLQFDASVGFAGKIVGFAVPDQLDLRDIAFGPGTTLSFAQDEVDGVLTATDGSHTARLALAGSHVTANFTTASDANGGTLVEIAEPPPIDNKITVDGSLLFVSETGVAATDRVVMNGAAGEDFLIAGSNAVMTGGAGTYFELTTPGSPGSPDTNRITNFTPGVDRLQLDSAGFDLGANPVAASLFTTGILHQLDPTLCLFGKHRQALLRCRRRRRRQLAAADRDLDRPPCPHRRRYRFRLTSAVSGAGVDRIPERGRVRAARRSRSTAHSGGQNDPPIEI